MQFEHKATIALPFESAMWASRQEKRNCDCAQFVATSLWFSDITTIILQGHTCHSMGNTILARSSQKRLLQWLWPNSSHAFSLFYEAPCVYCCITPGTAINCVTQCTIRLANDLLRLCHCCRHEASAAFLAFVILLALLNICSLIRCLHLAASSFHLSACSHGRRPYILPACGIGTLLANTILGPGHHAEDLLPLDAVDQVLRRCHFGLDIIHALKAFPTSHCPCC